MTSMTQKVYRVRNWSDYNRSLVARGSLTIWFSQDVVQEWEHKPKYFLRGRNNYYSNVVILTALTLRQLFRITLRQTEGLMTSLIQLLGQNLKVPDYTTLCRRAKFLPIDLKSRETNQKRHILVDSTGIQIIGEGEWKKLKHGQARYQVWKKLHIAMDANEHIILSATITDSVRQDGNYLSILLNKINGPIEAVVGDGAYDKKPCYQEIYLRGAKPIIPPQHNACPQRNKVKINPALLPRDELIKRLGKGAGRVENLRIWKQESGYHIRSRIENMMSRMKTIFGDKMRARSAANQYTDLMIRCHAMNKMSKMGLPKSEAVG